MKASELKVGDVVDVIRKDVTITHVDDGLPGVKEGCVKGSGPDGARYYYGPGLGQVEFTNLRRPEPPKPAHWPPQAGDVWLSETGTEWHVVTDGPNSIDRGKKLIARPDDGKAWPTYDTRVLTERCTLVYRKGDAR